MPSADTRPVSTEWGAGRENPNCKQQDQNTMKWKRQLLVCDISKQRQNVYKSEHFMKCSSVAERMLCMQKFPSLVGSLASPESENFCLKSKAAITRQFVESTWCIRTHQPSCATTSNAGCSGVFLSNLILAGTLWKASVGTSVPMGTKLATPAVENKRSSWTDQWSDLV